MISFLVNYDVLQKFLLLFIVYMCSGCVPFSDEKQEILVYSDCKQGRVLINDVSNEVDRLRCYIHFKKYIEAYKQIQFVDTLLKENGNVVSDSMVLAYEAYAAYVAHKLGKIELAGLYYALYVNDLKLADKSLIKPICGLALIYGKKNNDIDAVCSELEGQVKADQYPLVNAGYWLVSSERDPYPRKAIVNKISGYGLVEFSIDCYGKTYNIKLIESSPKRIFSTASIRYVSKLKFLPARKNGSCAKIQGVRRKVEFDI